MFRSYLLKILLFLIPGIGFLLLNYLFLRNTGELLSLPKLVQRQQTDSGSCVYGTAIHDDTFYYKLEEYAYRKPDVAVLGSSRVMQLQEDFFSGSFFNFGGSMSSINKGEQLFRSMIARHKPKLILVGIDFWWFNSQFAAVKYSDHLFPPQSRFQLKYLFEPVSFLFQGKISISRYVRTLLHPPFPPAGDLCCIGVSACFTGVGYDPDGSYEYGNMLIGKAPENADEKFADTINRIRTGSNRFEYADRVDSTHWAHFLNFVHDMQAEGTEVVLYFPPLAPTAYREIDRERTHYGYFAELRQLLHQANLTFYDFEDPSTISTIDCEFIDGFHSGAVTSARLLLTMAQIDPKVRPFVDTRALQQIISQNQGKATVEDPRVMTDHEVDFLNIGCKK